MDEGRAPSRGKRGRSAARAAGAPPISTHPAFPAVVALWFAALFGLGCMVLPIALLEGMVWRLGLDAVSGAAQPPLGVKARLLIAATAAALGGGFGYWLARKVAGAQAPKPEPRAIFGKRGTEAPRPLSASDDLGGGSLDAPVGGKKRRSLAISDETGPSDYMTYVPVPGQEVTAGEHDEDFDEDEALPSLEAQEPRPLDMDEVIGLTDALELAELADEEPEAFAAVDFHHGDADVEDCTASASAQAHLSGEMAKPLPFSAPSQQRRFDAVATEEDVERERAPAAPSFRKEPIRFDISPRVPQVFEAAPEPVAEREPEPGPAPQLFAPPVPENAATNPAERPDMPHDDQIPYAAPQQDPASGAPGLMDLAERLGGALRERREQAEARATAPWQPPQAAPQAAGSAVALGAEEVDPLGADDVASAVASFFTKPAADPVAPVAAPVPQAFDAPRAFAEPEPEPEPEVEPEVETVRATQPAPFANPFAAHEDDEDEDEDDAVDFTASLRLPLGSTPPPRQRQVFLGAAPQEAEEVEEGDDAGETDRGDAMPGFGSLTEMANPFVRRQEFVRVEEPEDAEPQPSVTFPPRAVATSAVSAAPEPAPQADARPFDPPAGMKEAEKPADREKAERELREALETLQRLSGAA